MLKKGIILFAISCLTVSISSAYMIENFESATGIYGRYFAGYFAGGEGSLTTEAKIPGWEGSQGWDGTTRPDNWGFDGMYYNTWETPFWQETNAHSGLYAGGLGNSGNINANYVMYKDFIVPSGGFSLVYWREYELDSPADVYFRLYDQGSPFIITLEHISPTTLDAISSWTKKEFNIPGFFYRGSQLRFVVDWRQGNNASGFSHILLDDLECPGVPDPNPPPANANAIFEPTTISVLGMSFGALALMKRRKVRSIKGGH